MALTFVRPSTVNLAYHIKDDRYSYIEKYDRSEKLKSGVSNRTLAADAFDANAWLVSIRQGLASVPAEHVSPQKKNSSRDLFSFAADSLPPMTSSNSAGFLNGLEATVSTKNANGADRPDCFALVGTNRKGTVLIQWCNPRYKNNYINVAGVMNQATVVVTEFCPGKSRKLVRGDWNIQLSYTATVAVQFAVSKAHFLFTSLGLRHLIVLGGESGGRVVGVITRINLLKESIEERTGYIIDCD